MAFYFADKIFSSFCSTTIIFCYGGISGFTSSILFFSIFRINFIFSSRTFESFKTSWMFSKADFILWFFPKNILSIITRPRISWYLIFFIVSVCSVNKKLKALENSSERMKTLSSVTNLTSFSYESNLIEWIISEVLSKSKSGFSWI